MKLKQVETANDVPINSTEPVPGAWILFTGKPYSKFGHGGIIMAVGTSTLKVLDANYKPCEMTVRIIKKDDKRIRGFYWNPITI